MNLTEKLDLLMKNRGLTRRRFALQAGIPYTTIVNFYEKGTDNVKLSTLRKIAAFFGVSFDYLADETVNDPNHGKAEGFHVSFAEMQAVRKYRALDPHGRDMVDTVLQKEYARAASGGDFSPAAEGLIDLRHYWDAPSAGPGNDLGGGDYGALRVPATPAARAADFALTVSGRSMEPDYCDGDIVLVRSQEAYEIGDIVVFAKNGEGFIKRAGANCFESVNPEYPGVHIREGDSFRCFGVVLGKL